MSTGSLVSGIGHELEIRLRKIRSLLERGIFMTGPSKVVRPKKEGNRKENSWHFQAYKKTEMLLLGGKGFV
jgi:hypothetical protein